MSFSHPARLQPPDLRPAGRTRRAALQRVAWAFVVAAAVGAAGTVAGCTSASTTARRTATTTLPPNVTVATGPRTAGPDDTLIGGFPDFGRPVVFRVQSSGSAPCAERRCTPEQVVWDAVLLVPQSTRDLAAFLEAASSSAGWRIVAKPGDDGAGVLIATRGTPGSEERFVAEIVDASIAGNTRESSRLTLQIVSAVPPPTTTTTAPPPPPPAPPPPPT